ncbi:glycosyltransferase family protein [Pseudomonas coleopterorum]|uniref:glycosyltransferase family protein n=1 Tax=Pseudomonas coleopterorum TaxID=1605838 RepID=UPI00089943F6|nr:glycosyltransferase [Pseudomonas coleopterorum]SEE35015.1 Glycosyltransferase involved in cell wall bisynthesis [Pseudomonas coleopterorum]
MAPIHAIEVNDSILLMNTPLRDNMNDRHSLPSSNTHTQFDAVFYRTWFPDASQLDDVAARENWEENKASRPPNFNSLLNSRGLSLSTIPKDTDWDLYVSKHHKLKEPSTSQYHILFSYLRKQQAEKLRDFHFVRSYYKSLSAYNDKDLNSLFMNSEHGAYVGSIRELLEAYGFEPNVIGYLYSKNIIPIAASENLGWDWDKFIDQLMMQPVRKHTFSNSALTNAELYILLAWHAHRSGLEAKAEQLYRIAKEIHADCAMIKQWTSKVTLSTSSYIFSPNNCVDTLFYRSRYEDLSLSDVTGLERHWQTHGFAEHRAPTLEHELHLLHLNIQDLPMGFDWRSFLKEYEIDGNRPWASRNFAIISYLQLVKEGKAYEHSFYTSYYVDALRLSADPSQAFAHWSTSVSGSDRRIGNLTQYLTSLDLPIGKIPSWLDFEEIKEINSEWSKPYWDTIAHILRSASLPLLKVTKDSMRNADFYYEIGNHYEHLGNLDRAHEIYIGLLEFASHTFTLEHLGNIYYRAGLYSRAMSKYLKAVSNGNCSEWAYINALRCATKNISTAAITVSICSSAIDNLTDPKLIEEYIGEIVDTLWTEASKQIDIYLHQNKRSEIIDTVFETAKVIDALYSTLTIGKSKRRYEGALNSEKVLIVGDFFLPQCKRYRIHQKLEQLEAAGYSATAVSWVDADLALQEIALHDICIFYRAPALPNVVKVISTAKAMGKVVVYETDDLIFDGAYPPPIETYGGYISEAEYKDLVKGMSLYRAAAKLCNYAIGSTQPLVNELAKLVTSGRCFLHRNALDKQNVIPGPPPQKINRDHVNIFYGSGTKAHNSDFIETALPGLKKLMSEHTVTRLVIVGYLNLPTEFLKLFSDRIVQIPLTDSVETYWSYLSAADINLAVLIPDALTDSKSELKWFEAAIYGIPSVVSPTQNYIDVINEGEDGLIAFDLEHWYEKLEQLVRSPELRHRIGDAAYRRVVKDYGVPKMSQQLRSTLDLLVELQTSVNNQRSERSPS